MIHCIFGKKGSGKTTLSKQLMYEIGGRVVFLSPVESLDHYDYEVWRMLDIKPTLEVMKEGDICIVRLADEETFDLLASLLIIETDFTLVIDEVERYKWNQNFFDLIHYARHFNIEIIANTRRYVDVPRLLTSQADKIYVFATDEPRDVDYLRSFGVDMNIVTSLQLHEYYIHPDKVKAFTKAKSY